MPLMTCQKTNTGLRYPFQPFLCSQSHICPFLLLATRVNRTVGQIEEHIPFFQLSVSLPPSCFNPTCPHFVLFLFLQQPLCIVWWGRRKQRQRSMYLYFNCLSLSLFVSLSLSLSLSRFNPTYPLSFSSATLVHRMVGQKKTKTEEHVASMSSGEFFTHYPELGAYLCKQVEEAVKEVKKSKYEDHRTLYPVLSILAKLGTGATTKQNKE